MIQGALSPAAFVSSALFLLGVALFASLIPARRALRVDPMTALRHAFAARAMIPQHEYARLESKSSRYDTRVSETIVLRPQGTH